MARPPGHGPGYEIRRQGIIDTAAELFAERGYGSTGTADLGAAVGLGKGALYHYIGSKENLLVEIQDRVLTPLLTRSRVIAGLDANALVRLRLLSETLLGVIFSRIDHIWVYEHDYRHLHGPQRKRMVARRREFEQLVDGLLAEAIADGSLRKMDSRLATLEFLNLHNHTYQWAHLAEKKWTVQALSAEYCTTLFRGMCAESVAMEDIESAADDLRDELNETLGETSDASA